MSAPEGEKKMHPSKERVLKAYYGGKTEKEALESTRMRITKGQKKGQIAPFPDVRQHRKYRKELVNEGLIRKMNLVPGEKAHKWMAMDSFMDTEHPSKKVESPTKTKSNPKHMKDSETQYPDKMLFLQLIGRYWDLSAFVKNIDGIVGEIQRDESWRKRRRINRICNEMIGPLVKALYHARHEWGFRITLPPEYFPTKPKRIYHGLFGDTDLKGSLAVAIVDHNSGDLGTTLPGLEDWQDYLLMVKKEITEILETEPFPQIAKLEAKRRKVGMSGNELMEQLLGYDSKKSLHKP